MTYSSEIAILGRRGDPSNFLLKALPGSSIGVPTVLELMSRRADTRKGSAISTRNSRRLPR